MGALEALQPQQTLAPEQGGLPGTHQGQIGRGGLYGKPGPREGAIKPQAAQQRSLAQPVGQAGTAGKVPGGQTPTAVEGEAPAHHTAGAQPGSAAVAIEPRQLQLAASPAALQAGAQRHQPERVALGGHSFQPGGQPLLGINAARHPPGPAGIAPAALRQQELTAAAVERGGIHLERSTAASRCPAQLGEPQAAAAGEGAAIEVEPHAAIGAAFDASRQRNEGPQGLQHEATRFEQRLPALLLPVAVAADHRTAPLPRRPGAGPQIDGAPAQTHSHLAGGVEADRPGRIGAQAPEPHRCGLQHAEAQFQGRRLRARWQRPEHPDLTGRIAAQIDLGRLEAEIEDQLALAPAGHRVDQHRHRPHRDGGSILRSRQKAAGADAQAIGRQALERAELQRPTHHLAHLLLEPGSPVLVDAVQQIPAGDPHRQRQGADQPPGQQQPQHEDARDAAQLRASEPPREIRPPLAISPHRQLPQSLGQPPHGRGRSPPGRPQYKELVPSSPAPPWPPIRSS